VRTEVCKRLRQSAIFSRKINESKNLLKLVKDKLKINIHSLMDIETVAEMPSHPVGVMWVVGIFLDPSHHS